MINSQQKVAQIAPVDNKQQCMLISPHGDKRTTEISDEKQADENLNDAALEDFAKDYGFNINSELSHELRIKLIRILYKRRQAFARSSSELKTYNKQDFEIKMQPNKPMFNRQYKHKPEHGRILQQHINHWKDQKIVQPSSNFSFNSCIFLVPKATLKDATDKGNIAHYRPVLDLRNLN